MTALRRLHNRIDYWLDRSSLREPQDGLERLPGGGVPSLASHALERAVQVAQRHDRDARLKRVAAPRGAAADGAAAQWTFLFDLPKRRAKLTCDWYLDGSKQGGRFGQECLAWRATPFPPPDSVLAHGIKEGRLAYTLGARVWREERRRTPDLPLTFRDSDAVVTELHEHGLGLGDGGFTLHTDAAAQGPVWVAETPDQVLRLRFL